MQVGNLISYIYSLLSQNKPVLIIDTPKLKAAYYYPYVHC